MAQINIKVTDYSLSPVQLENFAAEFYGKSIDEAGKNGIQGFHFSSEAHMNIFEKILNLTFSVKTEK